MLETKVEIICISVREEGQRVRLWPWDTENVRGVSGNGERWGEVETEDKEVIPTLLFSSKDYLWY